MGDWGTAGTHHKGGTPMYAGPRTYEENLKDLFSFARLTLELFLEPQEWMYLTFFPQEDINQLFLLRNNLNPFLKAIEQALCFEVNCFNLTSSLTQAKRWSRSIFDEIIQSIPAANSASNIAPTLPQALDTLMLELEHLKIHRKYGFCNLSQPKSRFQLISTC